MTQNGKGSAPRQQTKESRKKFEANYDRIFGKAKIEVLPLQRKDKQAAARIFRHLRKQKKP